MRYFWSRVRHLLPLILGHIVNVCFCALGFLSTAINYLRGNTHKKSAKLFFTESPENPIFSNLRLRFAHFSGGIDGRSDSSNNNTVFAILTMTKRKKTELTMTGLKNKTYTGACSPDTQPSARKRAMLAMRKFYRRNDSKRVLCFYLPFLLLFCFSFFVFFLCSSSW